MTKSHNLCLLGVMLLAFYVHPVAAGCGTWAVPDTKGERFKLEEELGTSPFVLVFWATWCTPCKKEMDELRPMFEGLMEQGVKVLFISEDNVKSQAKVKPFVESKGYKWRVLLDPDGEILKRYGGTGFIPYTVVLDRHGNIISKTRGAIKNADRFRDGVIKLMAKDEQ